MNETAFPLTAGASEGPFRSWAPIGLIAIYLSFALTTFFVWWSGDRYGVTGDEPHYLVVAQGLITHRTLEQSDAYRDEFRTRAIYKPGFASADAEPNPSIVHVIVGPHGLYNKNAIGVPMLLIPALGLAGVLGAKLFLMLLSSLVVVVSWKVSGLFSSCTSARMLAVAVASIGMPLIPASSQVFPDLPAGMICLAALYWLMTADRRSPASHLIFAIAIAYLPWLHVKYAAAGVILGATVSYRLRARIPLAITALMLPLISVGLLATYHSYAFGNVAGPFGSQPLAFSKTAVMVLLGEHFDQNQGFLLQNPIFFVGVLFLLPFALRDKVVGVAIVLLLGAVLVPGAMHDQYGGHGFVGRFAWAGSTIFIIPTLYGLLRIYGASRRAFVALTACGLALQAYFFAIYTFTNADLYRPHSETWLEAYSLFYRPVHHWLPALYNSTWAFFYAPNFIFLAIYAGLLAAGLAFYLRPKFFSPRRSTLLVAAGAIAILVGGFARCDHCNPQFSVFSGLSLPSGTGTTEGTDRVAYPQIHAPGYLSFGPFVRLRRGSYQVQIAYKTDAPAGSAVAHWTVTATEGTESRVLQHGDLIAAPDGAHIQTVRFEATGRATSRYGFEIIWAGSFPLRLIGMQLGRLPLSQTAAASFPVVQRKTSTR